VTPLIIGGENLTAILEIILMTAGIYVILRFFRGTSAASIFTGVVILYVVLLALILFLDWAEMTHLRYIFSEFIPTSLLVILIVFNTEIRRALVELGGKVPVIFNSTSRKTTMDSIIEACLWLAGNKMGALICIERKVKLGHITEQGTPINAEVSAALLKNIFFKDSPLHDGAVVIRGQQIVAAQCLLPMSDNREISSELGTRHRAAVGLTEESDAVAVVVSEETQKISLSVDGRLEFGLKAEEVKKRLDELLEFQPAEIPGAYDR
jgi:diadenylate cyclase